MEKLKRLIAHWKNRELLAVTALCAAMIVLASLSFGVYRLLVPAAGQGDPLEGQPYSYQPGQACPVDFTDEAFGQAVAFALQMDYGKLTEQDLQHVTELVISDQPAITSLEDLRFLPSLQQLTLKNCAVSSLEGLDAVPELRLLDLSGNRIEDLSPLLQLTKLEKLYLAGNPVAEVPSLAGMTALKELDLEGTNITGLAFLKGSSVETLHISYTKLQSVDDLQYCTALQCLYLYGYNTMDLTALQKLENFHSIYLSELFDRSEIRFMAGRFKTGDKRTKVYLALENRGLGINE